MFVTRVISLMPSPTRVARLLRVASATARVHTHRQVLIRVCSDIHLVTPDTAQKKNYLVRIAIARRRVCRKRSRSVRPVRLNTSRQVEVLTVRRVITASVRLEGIMVLVVASGVTQGRVSALECVSLLALCNRTRTPPGFIRWSSISQLDTSPTAARTPPGFSRWYFNFTTRHVTN